ncbi:MAG TPA: M20/M25/M40 family metallo-hydrolase [Chitinophagaceae bacterium]|nr:M20/M25/M40 family metallo-hydrolase [Chitinophagaceae bacterium]
MKKILGFLFLFPVVVFGQKMKKADKQIVESVQASVSYLADDKLEGRRAGSPGEALAVSFITDKFTRAGLTPKGENNSYVQPFTIDEGRELSKKGSFFRVDGKDLEPGVDFYPLGYSPDSKMIEAASAVSVPEKGVPWFINLAEGSIANKDNPHFDQPTWIRSQLKNAYDKGASAVVLYNTMDSAEDLKYDGKDKSEKAPLPVVYVTKKAFAKYFSDPEATYDFKLKIETAAKTRTAHNVVGYIDNGAPTTVVLGAHFDHLGYGEDGNSMIRTGEKLIHNGADDNASGTAALLELASILKKSKLKKQNYLFVAFSGEELGLYGSKYYVEHPTVDLKTVSYMINMDMVGRMNDSTKTVTVGGFGTSPTWSTLIKSDPKNGFAIKIDSSGSGPSDHTSFYRKDIPVLFFFTGLHSDYHKPTDDAARINYVGEWLIIKYIYGIINNTSGAGKLAFTKTREQQVGTSTRFTVSMGIMPDYTFSGAGVRVDGISEGRAAQKAGIKAGDIVTQLGEHKVSSVESYMQALSKFKKGDATKVKVKRGNDELEFDIQF